MTPDDILETVKRMTGYSLDELCFADGRYPPRTRARYLAMWLLVTDVGLTPVATSRILQRDRKLIYYGVRKIDSLVIAGDGETIRSLITARVMLREAMAA